MSMIRSLAAISISVLGFAALGAGQTYYVDCNKPDDSGDGKTETTAKRTIQAAVDLAVDGDTVMLLPGEHKVGSVDTAYSDSTLQTRVRITHQITLTGRDGKEKTFIKGQFSTAEGNNQGAGTGAMRCIVVGKGAQGTVIERVTLCEGATLGKNQGVSDDDRIGGAVWVHSEVGNQVYLCDAIVSNCVAYSASAGLHRGTAVCSRFYANRCPGQSGGTAAGSCKLVSCIIARNSHYYAIGNSSTLVNCTIAENGSTALYPVFGSGTHLVYNSLIYGQYDHNGTSQCGSTANNWVASNTVCVALSGADKGSLLNMVKGGAPYGETDTFKTNAVSQQCYGPAAGDFRLLPDSDAVNWGDPKHLARVTVPAKYQNLDVDLKPINVKAATCHAGAVQTVGPTPATTKLVINSVNTVVNGFAASPYASYKSYVFGDRWPMQVRLTSTLAADKLLSFRVTKNDTLVYLMAYLWPDRNDGAWLTLPPVGVDTAVKVWSVEPDNTFYVNEKTGDDGFDGLTASTAKKTLQAASDLVQSKKLALVLVAPGVYKEGGATAYGIKSRLAVTNGYAAVFRSTGKGAEDTFIVGEPDPGSDDGYGLGATRCVALKKTGAIQGFTLTGGWTAKERSGDGKIATVEANRGGAFVASSEPYDSAHYALTDCVVSNNHGSSVSAVYRGILYRCKMANNPWISGGTGASYGGIFVSSLFTRDSSVTYILRSGGTLYNCTIYGDSSKIAQFCTTDMSLFDSILVNGHLFQPYDSRHHFFGNVLWGSSTYESAWGADSSKSNGYSYVRLDPVLADPLNFDCRPLDQSGVDGQGDACTWLTNNSWQVRGGDIDGNPLRFTGAKVLPGAAQTFCQGVYVTSNGLGRVTVEGGQPGWNSLAPGKTITVKATDAATRPFVGFRVDGELLDHSVNQLSVDISYANKTVEAVYTTDWYVDANNGNDAWDGQTPATARKTLAKIMEMKFVAGDTVHAAPGVYDRGTMTNGTSFYNKGDGVCDLPSRVVVPWSVRLVADEGPEKTFIVGSAATDSARALGLGPGAVRCATVCSSATLSGFTLTGGHTLDVGDVPPADKDRDDDLNGAGVLSVGGTASLVENCIISNNVAFRGGAVVYATVNRCRIFDCQAASDAAATWVCHINGSYIDHFRTDKPVVQYYRGFNSTTIGPDICDEAGNPKTAVHSSNDGNNPSATPAYNSVFLCKPGATVREVAFNSVFLQDSTYVGTYHTNCQMVATAEGLFDAAAAPIPGSGCPALGFADVARYDFDALGWTDVVGNPRFSNNAMDAGAIQSDWRKRYARVLGGGQTLCPLAATNVHEVVEGVRLETGSLTLSAKNAAKAAGNAAEVSVTVDGTGTLKVLVDGEVFKALTAAESPAAFTVPFVTGFEEVTFVYEPGDGDTGSATLNRCRIPRGMLLLVR